ncbi:MAG: NAD-dependent epimerase/dehydratase family protein [Thermoleophilia bacterium]
MKIFLAGASGVIGRSLLPMLVAAGHDVVGMSRSPERAAAVERHGAQGVVVDVFDRDRLHDVLAAARPEVVIDELSDLSRELAPSGDAQFDGNVRIRKEGTRNLVDAARAAGARRIVAQSYAHVYAAQGDWVKGEDQPLDLGPEEASPGRARNADAVRTLEQTVVGTPGIEGVALRYGAFYGPGTAYAPDGSIAELVRRRHFPIVGGGEGLTSFVYVDDAAAATMLALSGRTGVFNICDDDPAPMFEWVPVYAARLGAPPPRHVPSFVVRVLGREAFIYRATERRGASNAKAKALLGFEPCFRSWREGFETTLVGAIAA